MNNQTNSKNYEDGLVPPAEGIFYIVRFPEGWEPIIARFSGGLEMGHPVFWRERVVPHLSLRWATVLKRSRIDLESELRPCEYGFPRGRIVRQDERFCVVYGNEFKPFMKIAKASIEKLFGITGKASWSEDDHEHCLREDKQPLRHILRLKENWDHFDPKRFQEP